MSQSDGNFCFSKLSHDKETTTTGSRSPWRTWRSTIHTDDVSNVYLNTDDNQFPNIEGELLMSGLKHVGTRLNHAPNEEESDCVEPDNVEETKNQKNGNNEQKNNQPKHRPRPSK